MAESVPTRLHLGGMEEIPGRQVFPVAVVHFNQLVAWYRLAVDAAAAGGGIPAMAGSSADGAKENGSGQQQDGHEGEKGACNLVGEGGYPVA
jgi:hypothetical protein